MRVPSRFPAGGSALATAAGVVALVVVVMEGYGLSKTVGEPLIRAALFALALGVGIYVIGIGAAAMLDPTGFLSFRVKPWLKASPIWVQILWLTLAAALLIAVVSYRVAPRAWLIGGIVTIVVALVAFYLVRRTHR